MVQSLLSGCKYEQQLRGVDLQEKEHKNIKYSESV